MTNGRATNQNRHFTLCWLPWLLGAGALALYLLTANHNLSFLTDWQAVQQLPIGIRALGWSYAPEFLAPVYYAVTLPIRWLPATMIPMALNLFSVLCATLVIIQLARSVALLPHDRTRDQRERVDNRDALLTIPLAWLPPLFATLVCAFALTFWEHGTNGTGEMFDLLLFSYVLRSFLEFRVDENVNRLFRAALVYGLAITNNPAMLAFFPIYVGALVWTRKLAFFNLKFLGKMALCGLAGLSFYLLLPAVGSLSSGHSTFWELLQSNLVTQRWVITSFPRSTLLLLSLTTILPVLLCSIRWSSQFGDPSRIGVIVTTAAFHLCHTVVLFACLWMMLDPDFSPRKIAATLPPPSSHLTFLPLYYLAALSIGYYSGYLLLVSRAATKRSSQGSSLATLVQYGVTIVVIALMLLAPAILIHRNLPQIRLSNGSLQSQFATDLASGLPEKAIVLSDEPRRLWRLQEWLLQKRSDHDYIFACTGWLPIPQYQEFLSRKFPQWRKPNFADEKTDIPQDQLQQNLVQNSTNLPVVYLHPSFGYYFEAFSSEPNGLGSLLHLRTGNELLPSPLSSDTIERNRKFWAAASARITNSWRAAILPRNEEQKLAFPENLYQRIGLKPEQNLQVALLGSYYSRSLDKWGVELQRAGDFEAAAAQFELAQELNPRNVVAEINLAFNQKLRRGEPITMEVDKQLDDIFGESRSWEQVLTMNGPYDTPGLALAQGQVFVQGNLLYQAAQYFNRARAQATNDIASRLWLAQLHLNRGLPERTLEMIREVRAIADRLPNVRTNLGDLFTLEAAAHLANKDDATANEIIATNLSRDPNNFNLLASACKAYADNGRYTNALELTERMLRLDPTNSACLINRGCFLMEMPDSDAAIKAFSQVLVLETNNYRAILYRAIAELRADRLDESEKDYETVQRQYPKESTVDYGLAEIAYRRKDTNAAIRSYESYLLNAPPNTREATAVKARLNELKGANPKPETPPDSRKK